MIIEHTYTYFKNAILKAANVDITTKPTNQGLFHHSKDYLLTAVEVCDHLLTILSNMNEYNTRKINVIIQLRQAQTSVTELIAL